MVSVLQGHRASMRLPRCMQTVLILVQLVPPDVCVMLLYPRTLSRPRIVSGSHSTIVTLPGPGIPACGLAPGPAMALAARIPITVKGGKFRIEILMLLSNIVTLH